MPAPYCHYPAPISSLSFLALFLLHVSLPVFAICLQKASCEMLIETAFKRTKLYPAYLGVPDCFNVTLHRKLRDSETACLTEKIVYTSLIECADYALTTTARTPPPTAISSTQTTDNAAIRVATRQRATRVTNSQRRYDTAPLPNVQRRSENVNTDTRRLRRSVRQIGRPRRVRRLRRRAQGRVGAQRIRASARNIQFSRQLCGAKGACCLLYNSVEYYTRNCFETICLRNSSCEK